MKSRSSRVGIRELRQNLSVYLRRVTAGEVLEVTERGRAVAVLAPLPETRTAIEKLVALGRAIPAKNDLCKLGLPRRVRLRRSVSLSLQEEREERL